MRLPVVRFPGGTDVDYIDWRDCVSNCPGRTSASESPREDRPVTVGHTGREITNNFGYDEFLALCAELGSEPLVVVNLLDALSGKRPPREAALHAAGLVAYLNAPVGARLPEGMPDWPAVRARNGRIKPWGARYFQIGNETWGFYGERFKGTPLEEPGSAAKQTAECIGRYIELMREVDPSIEIVIDGRYGHEAIEEAVLADPAIRDSVQYAALHHYRPEGMDRLTRGGRPHPHGEMATEDWWRAWVGMPGHFAEDGTNAGLGPRVAELRSMGYRVACTEWNWNGWGYHRLDPKPEIDFLLAAGIGSAGFIHGLMRQGGDVRLATQSMLVGEGWDIDAIRADPEGRRPPYYHPQGHMTMFYNLHHGSVRLGVKAEGVPTYEQPYGMGSAAPVPKVAYLDVVATADEGAVYLHAINRHFKEAYEASFDLSALGALTPPARAHVFTGRLRREPAEGEPPAGRVSARRRSDAMRREVGSIREEALPFEGGILNTALPERSVSIIEIQRRQP